MKKIILSAAALAAIGAGNLYAQDIYKVDLMSHSDLNGDARYVGMGGAMNALGANLTAMGSNPASAALYRRSDVGLTAGLVHTPFNGNMLVGPSKTRASFDQAGILYACNLDNYGGVKFINIGFNYHKSRNFKNYIGLDFVKLPLFVTNNGIIQGMSQSWEFADLAYDNKGNVLDLRPTENNNDYEYTTPSTVLAFDSKLIAPYDKDGNEIVDDNTEIAGYNPSYANNYDYHRAQWGAIEDYDFSLSLNINERVYLGAVFTVHNVDMHSSLLYTEELYQNGNVNDTGIYNMSSDEAITGVGYDAKFGFLIRPLEENPFRFGITVATPSAYDLKNHSYACMETPYIMEDGKNGYAEVDLVNEYRIRTPWKLGINAGTTIGKRFAIDAEYEWASSSTTAVRYSNEGKFYEHNLNYITDNDIQNELKSYYKSFHTLRIGAEAHVTDNFAVRAGYNLVTPALKKEAYLNPYLDGSSYYYATNTDYVNPRITNRITFGLGYQHKSFYIDAAYQHTMQKAEVSPFYLETHADLLPSQQVALHRNQLILSMGYRF